MNGEQLIPQDMPEIESMHGMWSSRLMFILAAAGSAVGLGNIWRFPYVAGENGGGAFVLVYLACIAIIGIPVLMAEIILGRHGRSNPINGMVKIARESDTTKFWGLVGIMGVLAGLFIMSFYSAVADSICLCHFRATLIPCIVDS